MRRLDDTTILFDWNGTIVLDAERARRALNDVLDARELPVLGAEEFGSRFRLPMRELFRDLRVPKEQIDVAEWEWNQGMLAGEPTPRPGLAEALLDLSQAGARLGVISAASTSTIVADLNRMGLPDVWACVRGGVSDKARALLDERGDRAHAVYVGDTIFDMDSAIRAGYRPVAVSEGYTGPSRLRAAGAEAVVSDMRELAALINEAFDVRR